MLSIGENEEVMDSLNIVRCMLLLLVQVFGKYIARFVKLQSNFGPAALILRVYFKKMPWYMYKGVHSY